MRIRKVNYDWGAIWKRMYFLQIQRRTERRHNKSGVKEFMLMNPNMTIAFLKKTMTKGDNND